MVRKKCLVEINQLLHHTSFVLGREGKRKSSSRFLSFKSSNPFMCAQQSRHMLEIGMCIRGCTQFLPLVSCGPAPSISLFYKDLWTIGEYLQFIHFWSRYCSQNCMPLLKLPILILMLWAKSSFWFTAANISLVATGIWHAFLQGSRWEVWQTDPLQNKYT